MTKLNDLQIMMLADINEEICGLEEQINSLNKKSEIIYSKEPLRMFFFHEYGPEIIEVDALHFGASQVKADTEVYWIWNPIKRDKDKEYYPGGLIYKSRQELVEHWLSICAVQADDVSLALTLRFRAFALADWLRSQVNEP